MTASKSDRSSSPLRVAGRTIGETIRTRERELVATVLGQLTDEIDVYELLPPEALGGEITEAVERGIRLFLDTLATEALPGDAAVLDLSESAARRAEERIPLEAVIAAYIISTRVVIEQIVEESEVQETRDLGAAVALSLRFLRATTSVVIDRYQEERQLLDDVRSSAEQATLSELLAGTYSPDAHPNDQLATTYAVLRLDIGPNDDERTGGFGASVAAHRKLRRVRAAIDQMEIEGIISGLTATGGTLLVPLSTDGSAPIEDSVRVLDDLVGRVGDAGQASVHAATAEATAPLGIADAARLCDDILEVLQTTRRPPGLYRLDDVKLDVQLSRPGPARRLLAASLQPIAVRPVLLSTLRTYLASGMNRRRTALDLGVHPNTVDYRLRKIADLAGLDPTDPGDAFTFTACLHAHDTESGPPTPG